MMGPGIRWIALCASGEALGIAAVAPTYATIERWNVQNPALWICVAGAFEGFCLGGAQALSLRRLGINPARWILLTTVGALVGYGLSILGGAGGGGVGEAAYEPPIWMIASLGAALGVVMGVLMGVIQSSALGNAAHTRTWVAANAIGWAPAMAVIMLAASIAGAGWSLEQVAALGAASGAIAGMFVGAATLFALKKDAP